MEPDRPVRACLGLPSDEPVAVKHRYPHEWVTIKPFGIDTTYDVQRAECHKETSRAYQEAWDAAPNWLLRRFFAAEYARQIREDEDGLIAAAAEAILKREGVIS